MSAAPTTFGKYFLTEKIATGGMAEIYLAKLLGPGGFEKLLIIKQIHPRFGQQREFVELFVREAKTLVSLSHGNIVPVYELGVLEGTYFIAMEYIDGPTLAELLEAMQARDATVEPVMAAFICAEVLKGLDYAHRKGAGVIHRDLSPRNVMLSRDGEVKIVDFGIAATVDDPAGDRPSDDKPVGSFPYMSPEQVRHEPLSPASDLFSVGILLWEALTGTRLFARQSAEGTLAAVLEAEIRPPSALNACIPPELDEICLRALCREIDGRFASAGEFHAKLARFLYSVEKPVTANALSALVARVCPPVVKRRRQTTGNDGEPDLERTPPIDATQPMAGRSTRGSTKTFATHVQFRKVLERATPLLPFNAITDAEAAIAAAARRQAEAEATAIAKAGDDAAASAPQADDDAASAPSRRLTWIAMAALVAVAVAAGGFLLATSRSAAPTALADAGAIAVDAGAGTPHDAAPPDASLADAAPPPDARAKRRVRPDAAAERVLATGTLKVGVKPWAEVYIDGKKIGDAPGKFEVSEGKHTVRIVHDTRERTFEVRIEANAVRETPFVDFTAM